MTRKEIIENQIQLEALEAKFDKMIDEIERLNKIIAHGPGVKPTNFLNIKEVTKIAGLSRKTIEDDIERGRLKVVHRGKRRLVTQQAADEYLNK
jgi:excisionase family DNA binding protein